MLLLKKQLKIWLDNNFIGSICNMIEQGDASWQGYAEVCDDGKREDAVGKDI